MTTPTHQEKVAKLRELIKQTDIAMLTTIDEDGSLRSRPMGTQQTEFDGDLWFFTSTQGGKVPEIERDNRVNVSYASPGKHDYVSVSGRAFVVDDKAKMKALWSPIYKAYFPHGLDDPNLRLLKVEAHKAEYWDAPDGIIPTVIAFVQVMTGKEPEFGANEKLNLG